jgi:parallel beta-helix repeat protein
LATAPLAYAIDCGDVLGPGGHFKLQADLVCNTPITVMGPAILDLNGRMITSSPVDRTLIKVEGKNAKVRNGSLEDCGNCVEVGGDGGHKIDSLNVRVGGASDGIVVSSDHNQIVRNRVTEADFAFFVRGNKNTLFRNAADINFGDGFVVQGTNHRLIQNTAEDNVARGFSVEGSNNTLIHNQVVGTQLTQIAAFEVSGDHHTLIHNSAIGNAGNGFLIAGANHRLVKNDAETNGGSGIAVKGTDSKMLINTAIDNGDGVSTFDLFDDNADCDNNKWRNNTFDTRNQNCIR